MHRLPRLHPVSRSAHYDELALLLRQRKSCPTLGPSHHSESQLSTPGRVLPELEAPRLKFLKMPFPVYNKGKAGYTVTLTKYVHIFVDFSIPEFTAFCYVL